MDRDIARIIAGRNSRTLAGAPILLYRAAKVNVPIIPQMKESKIMGNGGHPVT